MYIRRPFETCIKDITDSYNALQSQIDRLRKENSALKDEHYKDEALVALKEENERLEREASRGFRISEEEYEAINSWMRKHDAEQHGLVTLEQRARACGCSGGRYTYIFTPTGVGTCGVIKCNCGAEFEFRELG